MTGMMWTSTAEDEGTNRVLSAVERAISSASLAFWMETAAKTHIQERARARFASEGDNVSGPWQALAPATIADRIAQQYPPGPILHRTGALEDYIVNNPGVMLVDPEAVVFETPAPSSDPELAAKYLTHQAGSPSRRIPARPMVGLGVEDAATLLYSLTEGIEIAIKEGIL